MKSLVFAIAACATAVAFAEQSKKAQASEPPKPLTVEQKAQMRLNEAKYMHDHFGGYVVKPGSQKGEIAVVNCQKKADKAWIGEVATFFREETKFNVTFKDGEFDFANPKIVGNATLFVIDDAKMPAILVAPENRWAFVNIAAIAKEERPAYFQARVKKQVSRTFALLCGASNSQYPGALTRGIVDEADLDKNMDYQLPMDVMMRMKKYMEPLGVTPFQRCLYRKAVVEGWAPSPTNDVQKKIWDKVHELPSNPIKIKPETKKMAE